MDQRTVVDLIYNVHEASTATGMDVSPKDVGFIISLFFEGLAHTPDAPGVPKHPELNVVLQKIADDAASVKDE